jgi:C-terminal processing protease CtpA/Prc
LCIRSGTEGWRQSSAPKLPDASFPDQASKSATGYVAIFPRAAYITWDGKTFEGQGIAPDHHVPWSFEEHRLGRDNQLDAALRILSES